MNNIIKPTFRLALVFIGLLSANFSFCHAHHHIFQSSQENAAWSIKYSNLKSAQLFLSHHYFILTDAKQGNPKESTPDLKEFYAFILQNIVYPAEARSNYVEGKVFAEFSLDSSGKLSGLEIIEDIGGGCGREVVRIITSIPVELNQTLLEKTGATKFILPFSFGLGKYFESQGYNTATDALVLKEVSVTASSTSAENRPTDQNAFTLINSLLNRTFYSIDETLEHPRSVYRLSLVNKGLQTFPLDIMKLENLEFLDLENNQIQSLPPNFNKLRYLLSFSLASNQLNAFPKEITSLRQLEALDLSNNQISYLPEDIKSLKNLRILILRNNEISSLPPELFKLKRLRQLVLEGNPISTSEKELLKSKLKKVEITF